MLVLAVVLLCQAGISIASMLTLRASLIADRTAETRHLVESAYSIVEFYYKRAQTRQISEAQARRLARDAVRSMRYGTNDYFFIWSLDGTGVAHGSHPEWEGKRFLNSAEARANPTVSIMVRNLITASTSNPRGGVTRYKISKLGGSVAVDKLSYTILFKPWGWSIGTGAYLDDIDTVFRAQLLAFVVLATVIIALAGVITYWFGRDLTLALRRLAARVVSVANGEFDGDVPETHRGDEVGVMARSLHVFRDKSREAVALTFDQLTGLPNRKLLIDRLKQSMAASARSTMYCGLMFVDLDKFKALNDSYGHDVGDLFLREVAARLTAHVREADTVARLGGDEFVIITLDIGQNEQEAAAVLEAVGAKIVAALNEPFAFGNLVHIGSASVGLTLFRGDAIPVDDLLKQADLAMYKAKETGRNACRFFDPYMENVLRERATLEAELCTALAEDQFELHYQAQIGRDDAITGAEALVRWNHPRRGLLQPVDFIPFAEESGLILPLGRWVLQMACAQINAWSHQPVMAAIRVAVNISTIQFAQPDFVEQVKSIIDESGADPHRLELEITEGLLAEDIESVRHKLTALRAIGVRFIIDDFGTRSSSLSDLKRIPLDRMKIDRSFVSNLLHDSNDLAIAKTIVALTNALGLGIVAEGVETVEQRDKLAQLGCGNYQGYLLSRPLPDAEFERFLHQSQRELVLPRTGHASSPIRAFSELEPTA